MKMYRRGETWWVYYWDPSARKRIRVSTGETDEARARAVMMTRFAPVMGAEEEDRLAAAAGIVKGERMKMRAAKTVDAVLAEMDIPRLREDGSEYSDKTREKIRVLWFQFAAWAAAEKGVRTVGLVTRELAAEWCDDPPSLGTRRFRKAVCRRVMEAAGVPPEDDPFRGLRLKRRRGEGDNHRKPYSKEACGVLLRFACKYRGAEFSMYLRAMIYTGLRMGDCATLKGANLDRKTWFLERVMQKTGKTVRFPLHHSLKKWFGAVEDGSPVFPTFDLMYRRNPTGLSILIKKCMKKAGVIPPDAKRGQYCAHCLRTTFASLCCMAGVPIAVIQSWLGHESQEVTRIYAQFTDDRLKMEAIERIPDL